MSSPRPRRVDVLMDPYDDVAVTRGLLARNDPDRGLLVVHPVVSTRQLQSLAHDVLAALGAEITDLKAERLSSATRGWNAARVWVSRDRIRQIVVLRAHLLTARAWTGLSWMADLTCVDLLLVVHQPDVPARLFRQIAPARPRILTSLAEAITAFGWDRWPRRRRPLLRQYPRLPSRLPTGSVLHWRADVFRLASPAFARVDEVYGRGLEAACQWLTGRDQDPDPQAGEERLQRLLVELVHDAPTPRHTLTLLRGAQAGFLLHGFGLEVPSLSKLAGPGLTSTVMTFETVARIRAGVANPVLAAGVALMLLTGLDPQVLGHLRPSHVSSSAHLVVLPFMDGRKLGFAAAPRFTRAGVCIGTAVFYVPLAVRSLIRAAMIYHQLTARRGNEPLLEPLFRPIGKVIREAAQRCGFPLPEHRVDASALWHSRVSWGWVGEAVHRPGPDTPRRDGLGCLTSHSPAENPAAAALVHRDPYEHVGARQRGTPAAVPRLLSAYLTGSQPRFTPPSSGGIVPPPRIDGQLVRREVAVRSAYTPPARPGTTSRSTPTSCSRCG